MHYLWKETIMFKRETRYLVLKVKDIAGLSSYELDWLEYLSKRVEQLRKFRGNKEPLECVIVEKDWPEYEIVWKMLEDRVNYGENTK